MQKVNFNYEECKELIEHFEGWPDELSLKLIQLRRCYESFNEKDTQVFKEAAKNYGNRADSDLKGNGKTRAWYSRAAVGCRSQ